ncbi:hypothetical protein Tco_0867042 [Tanacetum coccineum]
MVKIYNLCTDLVDFADMALSPRDQRHQYLRFEGLQYTDADIADFETRLGKIYRREVHRVQIFYFGGLTDQMTEGLSGGVRRRMSWREFILGMGLHTAEEIESSAGDFLGTKAACMQYCWEKYLRLFTEEKLQGLTVIVRDLPEIDMAELICEELDDTEGAPDVVKGDQAISAPVQAPQPPPAARTISQRLARLEEDVHGIQVSLREQREVVDAMARDFSRFTVWAAKGISQLLDSARATYDLAAKKSTKLVKY